MNEPIFEGFRPLEEVVEIITFSTLSLKHALEKINDPLRKGGCMCIARPNGLIVAVLLIGEVVSEERMRKYFALCQEKAVRLASHPEHVSSWQSRDETKQRYAGAIRSRKYILSFSGLPELWDEACMTDLAAKTCGLSVTRSNKIQRASNNPYLDGCYGSNFPEPACD
jgi:hypothetical protein